MFDCVSIFFSIWNFVFLIFLLSNVNGKISDEMGLGKTIQAIGICAKSRDDWPFLIICPSSLRFSWQNEIEKWLGISKEETNILLTSKDKIEKQKINIISFDLLVKMLDLFTQLNIKLVIIDESHFIKSKASQRTKAVEELAKTCERVILLSGTPALSRPEELFTQLRVLQPNFFAKFTPFAARYCDAHKGKWGYDTSGSSHVSELNLILNDLFMIRRKKLDVLTELPSKSRFCIKLQVEIGKSLSDKLDKLNQEWSDKEITSKWDKLRKDALVNQIYVETCKYKIPAVQSYIETFLHCYEDKVIIFCHHINMMDAIQSTIEELKVKFIRIDGSVPPIARQQCVDQFQTMPDVKVALVSITAGGTGITLNAASVVLFAELYWTPAVLFQAEDRAHRIGQLNNVSVYYLLAMDTFDEIIWKILKRKEKVVTRTIDPQDSLW